MPIPCPCCAGRMIIIEIFERSCQPKFRADTEPDKPESAGCGAVPRVRKSSREDDGNAPWCGSNSDGRMARQPSWQRAPRITTFVLIKLMPPHIASARLPSDTVTRGKVSPIKHIARIFVGEDSLGSTDEVAVGAFPERRASCIFHAGSWRSPQTQIGSNQPCWSDKAQTRSKDCACSFWHRHDDQLRSERDRAGLGHH